MKFTKPKAKPGVLFSIFVVAVLLALVLNYISIFQTVDLKSLDWRFSFRGPLDIKESPVVILAIDDQSDESTPARWPWPRSYFAHVIENLEKAGVAAIGIDVIFDQPDRFGAKEDDRFTAVLNKYDNIVLTGKILHTQSKLSYYTVIPPYEKFLTPRTHWGLAALEADLDGFYRRYPVLEFANDSLYPSLAAEVIHVYQYRDRKFRQGEDANNFYLGKHVIPKYDEYGMLINYVGHAGSFQYYSFDNVLDDSEFDLRDEYDMDAFDDPGDSTLGLPPGLLYSGKLKDKIVLIGSTMQELHDNFPTPFLEYMGQDSQKVKTEMPGVEIHANTIETILNDRYLRGLSNPEFIALLVILSLLVLLISRQIGTLWAGLSIVLLVGLYIIAFFWAFIDEQLVLPLSAPLLAILFNFIGYTLYQYLLTQEEKKVLRGAFAYYVPESVIQEIMSKPENLSLGGEEREITVLFSDVAGFTTISESLEPRELVMLLNEYLTAMTDIILEHKGIIDKYEGDAIMAEFGVPVAYEHHARYACIAALEMQKKLKEMRNKWREEGRPELRARIGINTGEVIVGNMGSRDVFDYTVMGDHVNLGSRLEGANKFYGTYIMISEFTQRIVKDEFYTRSLDLIRVKGKKKPIAVYELLAEKETKFSEGFLEMLDIYEQGIRAYRKQKWNEAYSLFEKCLKLVPDDPPSALYKQRCMDFRLKPPPMDWDGVTTMKEK